MSRTVALVLALFIAGVGLHIGWSLHWIAADERLSGSICCDLTGPVVDLVVSERTGYRPPLSPQSLHHLGGMSWLAFAASEVTGFEPDALLWTQLAALSAGQAALLWAVWPLAGPWGALAAALSLPLVPGVAFGAWSWAPFTLQSTLLALALGGALRGLHRPRWSLLVVTVGYLGATSSRLLTDDLLFLQSLGLVLGCAVLAALWEARTPRWRTALGALLTAGLLLGAVAWATAERGDLAHHLGYYADELGIRTGVIEPTAAQLAPLWSKQALMAYTWRLSRYELGWLWSVLLLLSLPGFLLRGRGRAAILAGGLGPLLILSLVAKKQIFYSYLTLPFAPLLVAVGLIGPLRRRPRAAALLCALVIGAAVFGVDTRPPATGSAPASLQRWQHAAFQFPYPLTLYPQQRIPGSLDSLSHLAAVLPETCPVPIGVIVLDEEITGALGGEPELAARAALFLAGEGRCARVYRRLPDDGGTVDVLWVGGGEDGGCQVTPELRWAAAWAEAYQATRWEVIDQRSVGSDGRCRTLLVRSSSRWLDTIRQRVRSSTI